MKILIDSKLYTIDFNEQEYLLVKNRTPNQIGFYAIKVNDYQALINSIKEDSHDAHIDVYALKFIHEEDKVRIDIPIGKRRLGNLMILNTANK